jgi:hypothetical protein
MEMAKSVVELITRGLRGTAILTNDGSSNGT